MAEGAQQSMGQLKRDAAGSVRKIVEVEKAAEQRMVHAMEAGPQVVEHWVEVAKNVCEPEDGDFLDADGIYELSERALEAKKAACAEKQKSAAEAQLAARREAASSAPAAAQANADMSLSVIANVPLELHIERGDGEQDTNRLIPFKVVGPPSVLAFILAEMKIGSLQGLMSPFFNITLDAEARVAAGIPCNAEHFAFCYPVDGLPVESLIPAAAQQPWLFHVLVGGFVYFDQHAGIIQVNALGLNPSATSLHLVGPFTAAASAISHLESSARMQPIVLKDMVDAGFRSFCWIHPAEAPGGVPLSTEHLYNDGAFVYQTTAGSIFYVLSMYGRTEPPGEDEPPHPMSQLKRMWRSQVAWRPLGGGGGASSPLIMTHSLLRTAHCR